MPHHGVCIKSLLLETKKMFLLLGNQKKNAFVVRNQKGLFQHFPYQVVSLLSCLQAISGQSTSWLNQNGRKHQST